MLPGHVLASLCLGPQALEQRRASPQLPGLLTARTLHLPPDFTQGPPALKGWFLVGAHSLWEARGPIEMLISWGDAGEPHGGTPPVTCPGPCLRTPDRGAEDHGSLSRAGCLQPHHLHREVATPAGCRAITSQPENPTEEPQGGMRPQRPAGRVLPGAIPAHKALLRLLLSWVLGEILPKMLPGALSAEQHGATPPPRGGRGPCD